MCRIVGFVGKQNAAPILLKGLQQLEYRGYDSAGIAVMDDDRIRVEKVSGRIARLCEKTDNGASVHGSIGIGHTRWATHGAPTDINAHPHLSNDGRFAIVHNGIIENYLALREELIADGYVFQSETDTETIVHLLEKYYDGDIKTAVMKTAARLEGSYALGILCADAPDPRSPWRRPRAIPRSLPRCTCLRSIQRKSWGACRKPNIPFWYAL